MACKRSCLAPSTMGSPACKELMDQIRSKALNLLGGPGPSVSALGISQTVRDNMLPNTPLFDLPGSNWMQASKLQRLQWGETKRHFKGTNSKEYRTLTPKNPLLGTFRTARVNHETLE